jgi:HAD superfamily hydrolase (TIGR01509 family)
MTAHQYLTDHLPPAVVFDCDGTIADTETLADHAWADALRPYGYEVTTEDFDAVIGQPWHRCWAYFSDRAGLDDETRFRAEVTAHFVERFDRDLVVYEDAVETMHRLAAAGVRLAVASSSRRESVEAVLDRAGTRSLVAAIVGQEDVAHHKPDPEPYVTAARLLEVDPAACSAVEDTQVGVAAAVAAGMFTVGILRRSTTPDMLGAAHRVVRRVTVDALVPQPADGGRSARPHGLTG